MDDLKLPFQESFETSTWNPRWGKTCWIMLNPNPKTQGDFRAWRRFGEHFAKYELHRKREKKNIYQYLFWLQN